ATGRAPRLRQAPAAVWDRAVLARRRRRGESGQHGASRAIRVWDHRRAGRHVEYHAGLVRLPHPHRACHVGADAAHLRRTHVVPPKAPLDPERTLRKRPAALPPRHGLRVLRAGMEFAGVWPRLARARSRVADLLWLLRRADATARADASP